MEGEELFSHVKKSYEEIELGEKKLLEIKNLESGELRIGASDMTLRFYLLPYLEKYHETYPHIKVNGRSGQTAWYPEPPPAAAMTDSPQAVRRRA